jgi:DNA polymerase-3 subunit alpha
MEIGYFVYIRGKIQNRWGKEDDFELKVQSMEMLNETRKRYLNKITLTAELSELNKTQLSYLLELPKTKPGNCTLNLEILDTKEQSSIKLLSTKIKFDPINEVLASFDSFGMDYKFN